MTVESEFCANCKYFLNSTDLNTIPHLCINSRCIYLQPDYGYWPIYRPITRRTLHGDVVRYGPVLGQQTIKYRPPFAGHIENARWGIPQQDDVYCIGFARVVDPLDFCSTWEELRGNINSWIVAASFFKLDGGRQLPHSN